jgi:hypothetical protein
MDLCPRDLKIPLIYSNILTLINLFNRFSLYSTAKISWTYIWVNAPGFIIGYFKNAAIQIYGKNLLNWIYSISPTGNLFDGEQFFYNTLTATRYSQCEI